MHARNQAPSPPEVATEAGGLLVGLGIITMALSPFALPGLVLALPLIIPVIPLALLAGALWLLTRLLVLPFRLVRSFVRSRSGTELHADASGSGASCAANA
jgi:hypothetical protein